jgi:hypothetical protein
MNEFRTKYRTSTLLLSYCDSRTRGQDIGSVTYLVARFYQTVGGCKGLELRKTTGR